MPVACNHDSEGVFPAGSWPLPQHRLTLVISSLNVGGAERVMALLANAWAEQGHLITLLTLDDGLTPPFFPLHGSIAHHPLNLYAVSGRWLRRISNNLRRFVQLRREIAASSPQAVICFMDRTNVLVLMATRMLGVPVIVAEHTAVGAVNIGSSWEFLRRIFYPRASAIVVLTERGRDALPFGWRNRTLVIPNPVVLPAGSVDSKEGLPDKYCVAMGSLREEKGFDLLLQAFAEVVSSRTEWSLVIIGSGPLHDPLVQLAVGLGIADRVLFLGMVAEPRPCLMAAQFFVLSSRREGFPLALCEAMACGLPVVATDCATGPREIVRPGIDGVLVPPEDISTLAAAMAQMMDDEDLRKSCARNAPEILERFSLQSAVDKWAGLLQRVIDER